MASHHDDNGIPPQEGKEQDDLGSTFSIPPPSSSSVVKDIPGSCVNRSSARGGQLFCWGRNSAGQCGTGKNVKFDGVPDNCSIPHPVRSLATVVHVSCGTGQQGCTLAVCASGSLFAFGANTHSRLGFPAVDDASSVIWSPRLVEVFEPSGGSSAEKRVAVKFVSSACGSSHSLAVTREGTVYGFGSNAHGCLGIIGEDTLDGESTSTRLSSTTGSRRALNSRDHPPTLIASLPSEDPVVQADADEHVSAVVTKSGALFMWGGNSFGRLGLGDKEPRSLPHRVGGPVFELETVRQVSCGSVYTAAVTTSGKLFCWGWGGHGNLGLGHRRSSLTPALVEGLANVIVVQVACTRGQEGFKGGLAASKQGGAEGPHTYALSQNGDIYSFGTCHKGLLCNLGAKTGGFGRPEWDELSPYRIGDPVRNGAKEGPISPFAVWPPPYDSVGPFNGVVSGHIHAASIDVSGRAWAWGCGSNDGRAGVERFLNMSGEGKPPRVDAMKCYMMGPHRVGVARKKYWSHGASLQDFFVWALATGRNHMACIASPDDSVPSYSRE